MNSILFLCVLIVIVLFVLYLSYVVTATQTTLTQEFFDNKPFHPLEKISVVLKHLKAYFISKNKDANANTKSIVNDAVLAWDDPATNLTFQNKGMLYLKDVSKLNSTTIVSTFIPGQKNAPSKNEDNVSVGEVIANAQYSVSGEPEKMSLHSPAEMKDKLEQIRNLVKKNDEESMAQMLVLAENLAKEYNTLPNKGRVPKRNTPLLNIRLVNSDGISNTVQIILPSSKGPVMLRLNQKETLGNETFLEFDKYNVAMQCSVTIHDDLVQVYINRKIAVQSKFPLKITFKDAIVTINPEKNLHYTWTSLGVLSRALDSKELQYFSSPEAVRKAYRQFMSTNHTHSSTKYQGKKEGKKCPTVTKDSFGNYRVEGISYGKRRRVAKEVYQINHPDCSLPDVLTEVFHQKKKLGPECPFVVHSGLNPCRYHECEGVDWTQKSTEEAGMNEKCRKRMDTYCEENAYLDPMCACWRVENKDKDECKNFRKKFHSPYDKCSPENYLISEHPDFDNYIRKDIVPCWGCDLE